MKESEIEKKSVKIGKNMGWISYKFLSPSNRGVPDRIFIKQGHVIFIEFKTKIGSVSELQGIQINKLKNNGCDVHIVRDSNDFKELLTNTYMVN